MDESYLKPTLESLPVELQIQVLLALPNLASLYALIRASLSYYLAYSSSQRSAIVFKLLSKELGPEVIYEAWVCVRTTSARPRYDPEPFGKFVDEYVEAYLPSSLPWKTCRDISQLHKLASYFASGFYSSEVARHTPTGELGGRPSGPSQTESVRIFRALYRFQLLSVLYRDPKGWASMRRLVQERLPRWEIDELNCIYEYLYTRFSAVYNDFTEHDIEMWNGSTAYDTFRYNEVKDSYLSLGLAYLHTLFTTPTWDARAQLLRRHRARARKSRGHQNQGFDFLRSSLPRRLDEGPSQEEREVYNSPFMDQVDRPNAAWLYSTQGTYSALWGTRNLRKWGLGLYVVWDRKRLDEWGVLEKPWSAAKYQKWHRAMMGEAYAKQKVQATTSQIRRILWQQGSTGYWPGETETEGEEALGQNT